MEDILDLYCRPYDERFPVVNMDEQPVQLIKETRAPIEMGVGRPARYDHEYERNGTANVFVFTEALSRWRGLSVREHRTAVDWAEEVRLLLEGRYQKAEKVILISDNLNTHTMASLYVAFEAHKARELARRLEIHYTPKHGSWLNIAECELSVFKRQCMLRRVPDTNALKRKANLWQDQRNGRQQGVNWRFRTPDARIRLKQLYPEIQMS